eukprot:TRINITY_DN9030_c0_g1_i1.p2 TRINITY_DN9030_c0_g1~~TRINITY_DN9030_c0_g1_i1.p2  ORF type:complete len:145 (-),score=43.14 TRINITY_DN9030_c0_g1_i1:219-653(-)
MYFLFFFFKQKTAYEMLRSLVGSEMCIRDRLQSWSSSGDELLCGNWHHVMFDIGTSPRALRQRVVVDYEVFADLPSIQVVLHRMFDTWDRSGWLSRAQLPRFFEEVLGPELKVEAMQDNHTPLQGISCTTERMRNASDTMFLKL